MFVVQRQWPCTVLIFQENSAGPRNLLLNDVETWPILTAKTAYQDLSICQLKSEKSDHSDDLGRSIFSAFSAEFSVLAA